jgi:Protein of unknown function (DUF3309)
MSKFDALNIDRTQRLRGAFDGHRGTYSCAASFKESMEAIMLSTILVVVLILILLGALPTWPYSAGWGYGPGGIVGLILVIVVILALLGRI